MSDFRKLPSNFSQAESYKPVDGRPSKSEILGDEWATNMKEIDRNLINDLIEGYKESNASKITEKAAIIFNENPNKGIKYCFD